ncbi:tenascin-like [Diaphorina citri]|uniref:Tenascin-like n=1 Tax=Diaphorina citri TaxID=121845 RepID=A0A3Q0J575_DIACI|nr:tenascin-like [Diaphorina citri]
MLVSFVFYLTLTCWNSCDGVSCGVNAVCVVNNHEARCFCPPGSYVGDPNIECRQVPCVHNHDCSTSHACDLLSHTCIPACDSGACGTNAVCIPEDHRPVCHCPVGTHPSPSPDVHCARESNLCRDSNPCHPTARCEDTGATNGKVVCSCPELSVGDPYKTGCVPQGQCPRGDADCPPSSRCSGGQCVSVCQGACGPNALCRAVGKRPVCACPDGFSAVGGEARVGCFREMSACAGDQECLAGEEKCIGGRCRVACLSHSDCSEGERCISSLCQSPCTSHSQCPTGQACQAGTCELGCRQNEECSGQMICAGSKCTELSCALGERCVSNRCEKICYAAANCLSGEKCSDDKTSHIPTFARTEPPDTQYTRYQACEKESMSTFLPRVSETLLMLLKPLELPSPADLNLNAPAWFSTASLCMQCAQHVKIVGP